MTEKSLKCQKCGSLVTHGMKFCESCGTKIEAFPACMKCGTPLAPDKKFCETCGAPVSPADALPRNAVREGAVPAAEPVLPVTKPVPVPEAASPAAHAEDTKIEAAVAAAVDTWTKPDSGTGETKVSKETGQKRPVPQKTMIIAGILVLALLGAAAYVVLLPMLSGPGTPLPNQPVSPVSTGTGSSSGNPATTVTSQAGTLSLTTGPTQIPPANRVVIVDAERDPITSLVTVTFKGGAGQNGVREILVTLTRSDGSVITKTFKPDAIGSGVTLQGTVKTDRVEVTTYFYTGEQYKILDQIFEYKKRGG